MKRTICYIICYAVISVLVLVMHYECAMAQIPSHDMRYVHSCSKDVSSDLSYAPPSSWSMPYNVYLAYFAIDSLCRTVMPTEYSDLLQSFESVLTGASSDSIAKYIYQAMNYDPLLMYKYIYHGRFLRTDYINPPDIIFTMYRHLLLRAGNKRNPYLAHAAGIYYVEVGGVSLDTTYAAAHKKLLQNIVCVSAYVLEAIKGPTLVKSSIDPETNELRNTIRYSYAKEWETVFIEKSDFQIAFDPDDGHVIEGVRLFGDQPVPQIGDRFVAVLDVYMAHHTGPDGTEYFLVPSMGSQPEGGLFKIENGNVIDSKNFFGLGVSVELQAFLNGLQQYIQSSFYN
jgi:hypothetical protein